MPRDFLRAGHNDPSMLAAVDKACRDGVGLTCELVNLSRSGETFWVELDVQPVFGGDGSLTGFIMIETDITERKAAEERLREASLFGAMLEESLNEIYVVDAETLKFVDVNRGARENLGYTLEDLREMNAADITAELTPERIAEISEALKSGTEKKVRFETQNRRKDGSVYDVEVHAQVAPGDPSRLVAFILDITERKAAEARLREAGVFGAMIEDSFNEVFFIDPRTTKFVGANRGARENLGYSLNELKQMDSLQVLPDLDARDLRQIAERLYSGVEEKVYVATRHSRKDGTFYDVDTFLQLSGGEEPRIVVFALDVTARKKAEAAADAAWQRLAVAIETLPDGFVLYDADDRLVICNGRYREIYSESAPAMVTGARFEDILRYGLERGQYADAEGREEQWVGDRIEAHRAVNSTLEQRLSDGRWLRIVERETPDGGRVGLRIDITDQLESRERAERAEQRLRDAINALPAAFWLFDADDRLVMFNERYREIFDRSAPAIEIGASFEEITRYGIQNGQIPDAVGREEEVLSTFMKENTLGDNETEFAVASGKWIKSFNRQTSDGGRVGFGIDVTELRVRQDKLKQAALTDPLTGLANRRGLSEYLENIARQADESTRVAIMHVDLDKFKSVNDAVGHDAGDHVLRHCARILTEATREVDLVARVGGDEFVVICDCINSDANVALLADRLVSRLSAPIPFDNRTCHVGASIGVAFWSPLGDRDVKGSLTDADIALQQSKTTGRGRYHFFEDEMRNRALLSAELAQEIYDGLNRDEFQPHVQPQFDISGKRIIGFESLIRWNHPTRGLLGPADFLFAAEEASLVDNLDQRMLEKSCEIVRNLVRAGVESPKISVNMSSPRLGDPAIVDRFRRTLDAHGVKPDQIVLEILESTLLDDRSAHVVENVHRLADAGFSVELDDFGTGHAAIANLRKYPIERIKIDRSLIAGIDRDPELVMITSAITNLAKSLGLKVLAEGVETPGELEAIRQIGCTDVQGYLFARPMSVDALVDWLCDRAEENRQDKRTVNF